MESYGSIEKFFDTGEQASALCMSVPNELLTCMKNAVFTNRTR